MGVSCVFGIVDWGACTLLQFGWIWGLFWGFKWGICVGVPWCIEMYCKVYIIMGIYNELKTF